MKSEIRIDFPRESSFNYEPNDSHGEYLMVWWQDDDNGRDAAEMCAHLRAQGVTPLTGHRWCKSFDHSGVVSTLIAGTPATLHTEHQDGWLSAWVSRNAAGELLGAIERATD